MCDLGLRGEVPRKSLVGFPIIFILRSSSYTTCMILGRWFELRRTANKELCYFSFQPAFRKKNCTRAITGPGIRRE